MMLINTWMDWLMGVKQLIIIIIIIIIFLSHHRS